MDNDRIKANRKKFFEDLGLNFDELKQKTESERLTFFTEKNLKCGFSPRQMARMLDDDYFPVDNIFYTKFDSRPQSVGISANVYEFLNHYGEKQIAPEYSFVPPNKEVPESIFGEPTSFTQTKRRADLSYFDSNTLKFVTVENKVGLAGDSEINHFTQELIGDSKRLKADKNASQIYNVYKNGNNGKWLFDSQTQSSLLATIKKTFPDQVTINGGGKELTMDELNYYANKKIVLPNITQAIDLGVSSEEPTNQFLSKQDYLSTQDSFEKREHSSLNNLLINMINNAGYFAANKNLEGTAHVIGDTVLSMATNKVGEALNNSLLKDGFGPLPSEFVTDFIMNTAGLFVSFLTNQIDENTFISGLAATAVKKLASIGIRVLSNKIKSMAKQFCSEKVGELCRRSLSLLKAVGVIFAVVAIASSLSSNGPKVFANKEERYELSNKMNSLIDGNLKQNGRETIEEIVKANKPSDISRITNVDFDKYAAKFLSKDNDTNLFLKDMKKIDDSFKNEFYDLGKREKALNSYCNNNFKDRTIRDQIRSIVTLDYYGKNKPFYSPEFVLERGNNGK